MVLALCALLQSPAMMLALCALLQSPAHGVSVVCGIAVFIIWCHKARFKSNYTFFRPILDNLHVIR